MSLLGLVAFVGAGALGWLVGFACGGDFERGRRERLQLPRRARRRTP